MLNGSLTKVMCCVLAIVFPLSAFAAETNAALVQAAGTTSVNGRAVTSTSAVYPGDTIQTGANSSAIISIKGSTVRLGGNSAAVYGKDAVEISNGAARVTTSKQLPLRYQTLTITPADRANTEMFVGEEAGDYVIAALHNPLSITDGKHTVVLPAGKSIKKPVNAGKGLPPGVVHSFVAIPGWAIGLIAAGAIGGAMGGLAAAGTFDEKKQTSPSQP
jgi:hypothetical protein